MANNCLVTKLKSVVDNDNLFRFGFATVEIFPRTSSGETMTSYISGNTGGVFKCDEDITVNGVSGREFQFNGQQQMIVYPTLGNYKLYVEKEFVKGIYRDSAQNKVVNAQYLPSLIDFQGIADIDETNGSSLILLGVSDDSNVDLSAIPSCTNIQIRNVTNTIKNVSSFVPNQNTTVFIMSETPVDGSLNLDNFNCKGLTELSFAAVNYSSYSAVGSIKDMCDRMYAAGRVSGTLTLYIRKQDGTAISKIITFSSSGHDYVEN